MKHILILLIALIFLLCSGCESSESSEYISTDSTETMADTYYDITDKKPPLQLYGYSWDEYIDEINKNEHLINSNVNVPKHNIITSPIHLEGCRIDVIAYTEYEPNNETNECNWDFDIYWKELNNDYEIRLHLFYLYKGVDTLGATRDYGVYDETNDIYTMNFYNGKTSFVCLLNDNMFIRFVIKDDCENFDSIRDQLIDYSLNIKSIANG